MRHAFILSMLILTLVVQFGWGDIPDTISYQGRLNRATDLCFAAGFGANAQHSGAFVWADSNAIFDYSGNITHFSSQNSDEFAVRCTGGARDDKSINSLDAGGVALAAIQGLCELVKEKEAR